MEFETISFVAEADSYDPVVLYEWDFDAPEEQFATDRETEYGVTSYTYDSTGTYTAMVRVTDSNGSVALESVQLQVLDTELFGVFDEDVVVTRDPNATHIITFDARALALTYPDIVNSLWEFGDGTIFAVDGPPSESVTHTYDPVRDYQVNLSMLDDDGNYLELTRTLHMVQPTIELISPSEGSVVRSGTSIRLSIGDDSPPLVSVMYSVNGGNLTDFETLYSISTGGWADGSYVIEVLAEDKDGNIVRKTVLTLIIDDSCPAVVVLWEGETAYGGDRINVSIQVDDANLDSEAVVLFVTFPGGDSPSQLLMQAAGSGVYYAIVEVPKRDGTLEFYVHAKDMANNTVTSEIYYIDIELRFIDVALPYLLLLAVAAALGTGAYFLRESRIAVDETFVIYRDGRMLSHSTRRLKPGMDDQVLSGMFVAIQDFIKDSFKDETSFVLRKLDFGEKSVLVEKGEHLFLAVVLHGKASKKVARKMKTVLDEMEDEYSENLVDWDGDLDGVRGVNEVVKKLYSKVPILPETLRRKEA
jgi:PKD repeat protein